MNPAQKLIAICVDASLPEILRSLGLTLPLQQGERVSVQHACAVQPKKSCLTTKGGVEISVSIATGDNPVAMI